MASSIASDTTSHSFISLGDGQPQGFGLVLQEITRPGVDGHAFREEALRSEPFSLIGTVDVNNLAALETTYKSYVDNYQGKICTVVDDYGTQHKNLVCTRVSRLQAMPLIRAVGGLSVSKGAYLVVRFDFVRANVG